MDIFFRMHAIHITIHFKEKLVKTQTKLLSNVCSAFWKKKSVLFLQNLTSFIKLNHLFMHKLFTVTLAQEIWYWHPQNFVSSEKWQFLSICLWTASLCQPCLIGIKMQNWFNLLQFFRQLLLLIIDYLFI